MFSAKLLGQTLRYVRSRLQRPGYAKMLRWCNRIFARLVVRVPQVRLEKRLHPSARGYLSSHGFVHDATLQGQRVLDDPFTLSSLIDMLVTGLL